LRLLRFIFHGLLNQEDLFIILSDFSLG